jgi:hypothetical protein
LARFTSSRTELFKEPASGDKARNNYDQTMYIHRCKVPRWVCEKIAQNVAVFWQNLYISIPVGKSSPKCWAYCVIINELPKENTRLGGVFTRNTKIWSDATNLSVGRHKMWCFV